MHHKILRIFVFSLFGAGAVMAGDCVPLFQKSHHRAQVVAYPAHFSYFVGAPVRVEALVQKELQKDPLWKEFQAFKAFRAQQAKEGTQEQKGPVSSFLKATCGRCHSGPEPKAGLILDGSAPIAHETVTQVLSWLSGIEQPEGDTMKGSLARSRTRTSQRPWRSC